jgi:hypothetical protein
LTISVVLPAPLQPAKPIMRMANPRLRLPRRNVIIPAQESRIRPRPMPAFAGMTND